MIIPQLMLRRRGDSLKNISIESHIVMEIISEDIQTFQYVKIFRNIVQCYEYIYLCYATLIEFDQTT